MKEKIVLDLRQAIKELNSIICNPEAAILHTEAALKGLNLLIENNGNTEKKRKKPSKRKTR